MKKNQFFKVVVNEGSDAATILLYGYIGENWWEDETNVTALDFVRELNRLASKYAEIHIRINSPGGDFSHGNAILTAIAGCTAEIHTWNDGLAGSMAADIWLMGKKRHMAKNAMLMIHPAWSYTSGHAKDLREQADLLDKITEATIIATAANLGMTEDEMRNKYYAEYKDVWLNYKDAVADGLINTEDAYDAENIPNDASKMTMAQLIKHYEKEKPQKSNALARLLSSLLPKTLNVHPHNEKKVTKEEFKTAVAEGQITKDDLDEAIQSLETPQDAALAQLRAEIETLKKQIGEKTPGAVKATPALPHEDVSPVAVAEPTAQQRYKDTNEQLLKIADSNETVRFSDGI